MVTVSQIYDEFPEFGRCAHALVSAKLADAERMTASDYAEVEVRDIRVKYLTAELLVLSPAGEFARLDPSKEPDGARSIYERRRLELDRSYTPLVVAL